MLCLSGFELYSFLGAPELPLISPLVIVPSISFKKMHAVINNPSPSPPL